jgi:hypothetical protein
VDLEEYIVYRMTFGLATALTEADQQNFLGRWRSNPAASGIVEAIIAEGLTRSEVTELVQAVKARRPITARP